MDEFGCGKSSDPAVCAEDAPDEDFGSSPILIERKGKDILVAGNKAAMIYALDPDHEGKLLWEQRVGKGSGYGGIVWGSASAGGKFLSLRFPIPIASMEKSGYHNSGGGLVAAFRSIVVSRYGRPPHQACGDKIPLRARSGLPAVTVRRSRGQYSPAP